MPLVLLVEGSAENRRQIRELLEFRFDVIEAERSEEAIQLLQLVQADLILLAMRLGDKDAALLVRRLKADPKTKRIPVVGLLADGRPESINVALAAGCIVYLTEPLVVDPFVLTEMLEQLIADSRT
jgi:CheY-like chemotaxis protein